MVNIWLLSEEGCNQNLLLPTWGLRYYANDALIYVV